jgi:hypothetical protein
MLNVLSLLRGLNNLKEKLINVVADTRVVVYTVRLIEQMLSKEIVRNVIVKYEWARLWK